jgi:hypothetical protein
LLYYNTASAKTALSVKKLLGRKTKLLWFYTHPADLNCIHHTSVSKIENYFTRISTSVSSGNKAKTLKHSNQICLRWYMDG